MDILRLNTLPEINVVPRYDIDTAHSFEIKLKNEFTNVNEVINVSDVVMLKNETFLFTLATFPVGKQGDKFSYTLRDVTNTEIVCLGKLMIVSETESVQDYAKKNNTKFYN